MTPPESPRDRDRDAASVASADMAGEEQKLREQGDTQHCKHTGWPHNVCRTQTFGPGPLSHAAKYQERKKWYRTLVLL